MLKNKRGQSTLEYIILMTAVVVAIIAFVVKGDSPFKNALNSTLTSGTNGMSLMANNISKTFTN